MFADIRRYTTEEGFAGSGLGHLADIVGRQLHGITAIRAKQAMAIVTLRRATVDDSYEIIGYDDAVLAFLLGVFRYDALLENYHC